MANHSGKVCGSDGKTACGAEDITIASFSRRSLTVSFYLQTYSTAAATSAVTTLDSYLASSAFISDLASAGSVTATSASVVSSGVDTSAPTSAPSSAPISDSQSDASLVVILVAIIGGVAFLAFVALIVYCSCKKSIPASPMPSTEGVDGNGVIASPQFVRTSQQAVAVDVNNRPMPVYTPEPPAYASPGTYNARQQRQQEQLQPCSATLGVTHDKKLDRGCC